MRVDLTTSSMPELDINRSSGAPASKADAGKSVASSDDVAKLSTGSDAVTGLKTQLNDVPDVRQQLVASLRQSIGNGTYRVSPDGIADRMLTDSTRTNG